MTSFELRVLAARIRTLYGAGRGRFGSGIPASALIAFVMSQDAGAWRLRLSPAAACWWLALLCIQVLGIATCRWVEGRQRDDAWMIHASRYYVWLAAASAVVWGLASWVFLPAPSARQENLLLVGMGLVLMVGTGGAAVYRPVMLCTAVIVVALFAAGLARLGDPTHEVFALGYLAFLGGLLSYAFNQESAVTRAIELSFRNEELLAERTEQEQRARRAQAEAEAAKEQAVRSERAKTAFVAAASHDLRQPMHALVQYVEHMKRAATDAALAPTIARIEESVSAMTELLNAVLDFSKISMGALKPSFGRVDVDRVMARIDVQMRPFAQSKGLRLDVQAAPLAVRTDEVLLERILRNLAVNAIKYCESGGVRLRVRARGGVARVLVCDSGIGIAAHELPRIFDEYYQVDNAARDRRRGLGLGLTIVRDLSAMLGLRVRVRSAVGRGSTFAIEIPLEASAARPRPATTAPRSADFVRGACVLLVDDDPLARDGVATTLGDFGCRVMAAGSLQEATAALVDGEFPPQVIVADYRLGGGVDGLQAIATLVEAHRGLQGPRADLPAVLVSGDTAPEVLERVARQGLSMLHKPVNVAQLHETLNGLLAGLAAAHLDEPRGP